MSDPDKRILVKLAQVSGKALRFVGSYNTPEREIAALEAVEHAFGAAMNGKVDEIEFKLPYKMGELPAVH